MEEIDPSNIVSGRTRRKQIDWAEAEQKSKDAGDNLDDDEDDDDEDFEAEDDDDEMKP
jgi:phosphopantothenoylcysteine synthetase/decarboxylase